jgi:chaperonin GroEL (HSP60 family)
MQIEYHRYGSINLILAQYALGKLEPHQLTDLAVILRTDVINQEIGKSLSDTLVKMTSGGLYEYIDNMLSNDNELNRRIGIIDYAQMSCTTGSIFKNDNIEKSIRYQDTLRAAEKEYKDKKGSMSVERQTYNFEIAKAQSRISQLKMENYIYYIGSNSELQRNILKDSVDDVIKCVRSAIKSGVVPGCQLSIIKACNNFIDFVVNKYNGDIDSDALKKISNEDKLKLLIIEIIQDAVIAVYYDILEGPDKFGIVKQIPLWNHIKDDSGAIEELKNNVIEKGQEIIKESIERNTVFDLEKLEYNPSIITSAETDINVLLAASDLVKLLISGNQCVFLAAEINGSEVEDINIS